VDASVLLAHDVILLITSPDAIDGNKSHAFDYLLLPLRTTHTHTALQAVTASEKSKAAHQLLIIHIH
jgi:hypothetical protein